MSNMVEPQVKEARHETSQVVPFHLCDMSRKADLETKEIWGGQWHPTPVLLPGKSRGQRSLVGCGPWGR